jgi:HD-GYP domain-containing protein (c-di-GMP phosphodiesterase class II)
MVDISDSNGSGKRDELNAAGKNAKSDDSMKSDDCKKQLNVRISTELYNKLDEIPESKGAVVTKALEKYLSEDRSDVVSQEYVSALLRQLDIKDNQIHALSRQLETKDEQITERDNTTKMHIAQVQTLINQVEKKTLELEDAKKKKWYQFW